MLEEFDSHELSEWQWYYSREPWGGRQDNLRAGTIATAALASNPYRGNASLPTPLEWFDRNAGRKTEDGEVITGDVRIQSEAEMKATLTSFAKRGKGK